MLNLDLYIYGSGFIAPHAVPDAPVMKLSASEPDYSGSIPPMQLRRMSKAVRMGIGAARESMMAAEMPQPDAIAVGTTLGCVADTEVFLRKMIQQEEQMLTPTAFIQSTHNTIAGQIALSYGCRGYNNTVVQRGHSFEGAVLSAALNLNEHPDHNFLVGGVDELTETSFNLLQRTGIYTSQSFIPSALTKKIHSGAIAGEGAGFLTLGRQVSGAVARIRSMALFCEGDYAAATQKLNELLRRVKSGDRILAGANGDARSQAVYTALDFKMDFFKQEIGEWGTAVAVCLAQLIANWPEGTSTVWVVNHYGRDFSVWELEQV